VDARAGSQRSRCFLDPWRLKSLRRNSPRRSRWPAFDLVEAFVGVLAAASADFTVRRDVEPAGASSTPCREGRPVLVKLGGLRFQNLPIRVRLGSDFVQLRVGDGFFHRGWVGGVQVEVFLGSLALSSALAWPTLLQMRPCCVEIQRGQALEAANCVWARPRTPRCRPFRAAICSA